MNPDRTTYDYVNGTVKSGLSCSACGTSYRKCTEKLYASQSGRSCCGTCGHTDTHEERNEMPPEKQTVPTTYTFTPQQADPELAAIEVVLTILLGLDVDTRRRVLNYVTDRAEKS